MSSKLNGRRKEVSRFASDFIFLFSTIKLFSRDSNKRDRSAQLNVSNVNDYPAVDN